MKSLKNHDTQSIDAVIETMQKDLSNLKKTRKKRNDQGKPRAAYKSDLPLHYRTYLNGCNKRGIRFELTVEQFDGIKAHSCVFCGDSRKIGIDRIDSSDHYHVDNCQPCCGVCNLMKFTHDGEFFLRHIRKILLNRGLI